MPLKRPSVSPAVLRAATRKALQSIHVDDVALQMRADTHALVQVLQHWFGPSLGSWVAEQVHAQLTSSPGERCTTGLLGCAYQCAGVLHMLRGRDASELAGLARAQLAWIASERTPCEHTSQTQENAGT